MRLRRRDLWTALTARLAKLTGSLVDQLHADIAAQETERRAVPATRYAELQVPLGDGNSGPGGLLPSELGRPWRRVP